MKDRFDIVVVGAGITGLTIAALLAQSPYSDRLRLSLVDALPRPLHHSDDDVGLRVAAIAGGSVALLERIGAWDQIAQTRACPYEQMRVWDESSPIESPATLRFDAAEFGVARLGFIVENVLLQHAILEVLNKTDIELIFSTAIRSLQALDASQTILLDDGRELTADLVIAADGARSFVRESAGIRSRDWPYGQSAFVTHVQPALSHDNTAWQRFLQHGPLGMLPLSDGRVSIVYSTTSALAEQALAASDAELGRLLSEASDYVLGELTAAGPRAAFPLSARHAEHYVVPGIALIGDAAHAVHPLAGQGANLGLQDAATLHAVLELALANNEHPGDRPVLRRYERARKGANATMLHAMTGLNRLFATDSAFVRELRKTGMRLFNHSGPLREQIVGVALGSRR